jgi:hypothetical protein
MWDVDIVRMRSDNCELRKLLTYRSLQRFAVGIQQRIFKIYSKFNKIRKQQ